MKPYIPYYHRLNLVLLDALTDIIDMFKEHEVTEIHLKEPMTLKFNPRIAGDGQDTIEVDTIVWHNGLLYLCSKDKSYCIYELSDKANIPFIYDVIYQHFNNN